MPDGTAGVFVEQLPHETDTFFAADIITDGNELFVRKHGSVTAKNNFRAGRVLAYQSGKAPGLVQSCDHKVYPNVVVRPCPDFTKQLLLRGIMQNDRGSFQILRNIVQTPTPDDLPVAEDPLVSRHLVVKQFSAHGVPVSVTPEWTADGRQKNNGSVMGFERLHRPIRME
jgi:hypothetical protein